MKLTYSRRYHRSTSRSMENAMSKRDGQHEHTFFAAPSHESFFKPNAEIHRKCDHCEAEEKSVKRGDKEDEKKVQKMSDKKEEEKIQRQPEKKEEEKIQKMGDKKEEDKTLHRQGEKKEEEKIQKMSDKKEEEKIQRAPEKKEEEKIQKMDDKKEEKELHRVPEKEEEKSIAKKESSPSKSSSPDTSTYIHSLNGKGSALPKDTQHFFGERMGYNFSNVRIHTDASAEQSAKDVNAKAYCIDNNIVFNKGQYNPASAEGKKLLAHELAHVVQQQGNEPELLNRVAQLTEKKQEEEKPVSIVGKATKTKNKTAHGCAGVEVHGQTDANYSSSFKTTGRSRTSTECTDCTPPDCVTSKGSVISVFKAKPVITLPAVPDGLTKCEAKAVRNFINGTLKRHEQQHVTAFKTYNGTISTPFDFTGCRAGLDTLVQSIHDGIDAQRVADADALSDALDPFNATIPCNCESQ
jgi:hypothetical protein